MNMRWTASPRKGILSDGPMRRIIAGAAIMLMAVPSAIAVSPPQQDAAQQDLSTLHSQTAQNGDAPGTVQAKSVAPILSAFGGRTPVAGAQNADAEASSESQSSQSPQQGQQTRPVGTAAAPSESTTGVAASRPAGAVIAPAKQRRVRAIVLKVGLLIGAGVAIGTVMALSHGSPSQP